MKWIVCEIGKNGERAIRDVRKHQESMKKSVRTAAGFEILPREQFIRAIGIGEVFAAIVIYARLSKFYNSQIWPTCIVSFKYHYDLNRENEENKEH